MSFHLSDLKLTDVIGVGDWDVLPELFCFLMTAGKNMDNETGSLCPLITPQARGEKP